MQAFPPIRRWHHSDAVGRFLVRSREEVLGALVASAGGAVEPAQRDAWLQQLEVLRAANLPSTAQLYFEYVIPRLGRRADVLVLVEHVLFVLEFKVGATAFDASALDQVWDYALDLKHFHEESHGIWIAPLLVATDAASARIEVQRTIHDDRLLRPIRVGSGQLEAVIQRVLLEVDAPAIDVGAWERSRYLPTPTIIEAARALYAGHSVEEISRSDAGARNLAVTSQAVERIIADARSRRRKAVVFVTGVPGAGKTLVGLDVANRHSSVENSTYSVFLSGNGPLVAVLREALTRDRVAQVRAAGRSITKSKAREGVEAFIQNVHHFRDESLADPRPPPEHVVLFDEAQRAWTLEQTRKFMERKKNRPGFDRSEPSFLISCLDRHDDWAVVVCLVGGGQEINKGEAGIAEWFRAVLDRFHDWDVHVSPRLAESEYGAGDLLRELRARPRTSQDPGLHLATSMRSFRAENLSRFVREVLDREEGAARRTLEELADRYPIVLTRHLPVARRWLRERARGSERYGLVVSSKAERLKPHAIDIRVKTDPVRWFLDGKDDTRSSYYLEDAATEFQVQGLELDWAGVVWDGDLRSGQAGWTHHEFKGKRWIAVRQELRRRYLLNAYRVLLTRARQGMVIVVPEGDPADPTRDPAYYDGTFEYLRSLGLPAPA